MDPFAQDAMMDMIQRGMDEDRDAAAERERALREDNERLRGKCNRLIRLVDEVWRGEGFVMIRSDLDLEPEPHDAASETEPTS